MFKIYLLGVSFNVIIHSLSLAGLFNASCRGVRPYYSGLFNVIIWQDKLERQSLLWHEKASDLMLHCATMWLKIMSKNIQAMFFVLALNTPSMATILVVQTW